MRTNWTVLVGEAAGGLSAVTFFLFDIFFGGNTDKSLEILEIVPKAVKSGDCLIGFCWIHT